MRVLVIQDDREMAQTIAAGGLRHAQMAADVAFDGAAGLERALINDYDVVVLDRDLPGCTATTSAAASTRGWRAGC